ncbi:MAG: EAL domain-containing protein, partial [Pseudomonadota bacterium]|nr:EAL domain-containing protein [Pseudomonadota bacterium]
ASRGKIIDGDAALPGRRFVGITFNIDDRKQAEAQRDTLSRAFTLLSRCNALLIHAEDEPSLLHALCRLAVEVAGYQMAWVGYGGADAAAPIGMQTQFGGDAAALTDALAAHTLAGLPGPSQIAIRSGRPVVVGDTDVDSSVAPWRAAAQRHGYRSSIACPLAIGGHCFGVLNIYARETDAFSAAETTLLEELAGNLSFGIGTLRMRADSAQAKIALVESEAHYRDLLVNLHTAVVVHGPDTQIVFSNPRAAALLGLSEDQLRGKVALDPAWCFVDEDGVALAAEDYPVSRVRATLKPLQSLLLGVCHPPATAVTWLLVSAFPNFDGAGRLRQIVVNFDDISARKQAEEHVHQMAFFDLLTGLPNRRLMMDRLQAVLAASGRNQQYGALLFIDLDKFKTINDVRGHQAGDLLLIGVAARIRASVREHDTVARLGGDEFVVLLAEIGTEVEAASQRAAGVAEKIRLALNAPFDLNGHPHHTSPSIGVSLFCGAADAPEVLLRQADMAMYKAKEAGRNTLRFFSAAMQMAVETHAALEADLRHAVPERQLHLHFQLQVDAALRPLGAEALVRWIHPRRGMVSPLQFIPIAEESSLMLDIGDWVLETACVQLAKWAANPHLRELTLAVNVSAQQFRQADFVDALGARLARHGCVAKRLKLELTESVIVDDVGDVVRKMHRLREIGVALSMDDFGTGYSSLSYLKMLPLDQIKIDQSFTRDISTDPTDAVMVKTIIDLAHNFKLHVIAEGVETEEQLAFLQRHGCMAYQGYLFGKPLPIACFEALAEQQCRAAVPGQARSAAAND